MALAMLAVAYAADLLIGDPRWFPHPVRGMGWMIDTGERALRALIPWERAAGAVLVIALVGGWYAGAASLLSAVTAGSIWIGAMLATVLLFSCLSTRDLAVESHAVLKALEADDLPLARRRVSRIVGRDTETLDSPGIVRATLETIAESTLDGIVSPLSYFVLGGVPLAVAYKVINTLDSMIGHRSARYIRFGWAAATVDTAANWVPARLCAVIYTAAAWVTGRPAGATWRCAWKDGGGGPVPNAGIPEAAMAGALGVRLGGTNWYQGQPSEMPFMGVAQHPLTPDRIREGIHLMYACSVVSWVMAMACLLGVSVW